MSKRRVLFVASTGGHLNELMQLQSMFDKYDFNLITEKTKSNLWLKDKYKNKRLPIKTLLLDQSIITGIGNIYADEILFG